MDETYWRYLEYLVDGKVQHEDAPHDVYEQLREAAYRGEIAWGQVGTSSGAQRAMSALFEDMARNLTTAVQLRGLLRSLEQATEQPGKRFAPSTGRAGRVLLDRVEGKRRTKPLPAGWEDVCDSVGGFWASRMLGDKHQQPPDLS